MNILLWVLQALLALHTFTGAVWKWSNPEQTVPSLKAIPHGIWLAMSVADCLRQARVETHPSLKIAGVAAMCGSGRGRTSLRPTGRSQQSAGTVRALAVIRGANGENSAASAAPPALELLTVSMR